MERPLELKFLKEFYEEHLSARLPANVRYKLNYGKRKVLVSLTTTDAGTLLSQRYSHYLFYIEVFEVRLTNKLELHYVIKDASLFLFMMMDGEIIFSTLSGQVMAHATKDICYVSYNRPSEFRADLRRGLHRFVYISFRKDWLKEHLKDIPKLETMIQKLISGNGLFDHAPSCLMTKQMYQALKAMFKVNTPDPVQAEMEYVRNGMRLLLLYHSCLERNTRMNVRGKSEIAQELGIFLKNNYSDPAAGNISRLAKMFLRSERTIQRIFSEEHRESIHEYLTNVRMEQAVKLLSETNWPVNTVSKRCGFRSAAHFTTSFKKYFGLSPYEVKMGKRGRS